MQKEWVALSLVAVFVVGMVGVSWAKPNPDLRARTRGSSTLYVDCAHIGDTAPNGDTIFTDTGGVVFTGGDYTPAEPMHGILLTAGTGNLSIVMEGRGVMVLPVTVSTGNLLEILRGYSIATIDSAKTTFTGHIFPLF